MAVNPTLTISLPTCAQSRAALADAIEGMIALLDNYDADPDLEPDNDNEPWLGGGEYGDDRELDLSDKEPDADDESNGDEEPELGWADFEARYGKYGKGDVDYPVS
jgi:hypothetical protein